MAMRRRIKPVANVMASSRRKPKNTETFNHIDLEYKHENCSHLTNQFHDKHSVEKIPEVIVNDNDSSNISRKSGEVDSVNHLKNDVVINKLEFQNVESSFLNVKLVSAFDKLKSHDSRNDCESELVTKSYDDIGCDNDVYNCNNILQCKQTDNNISCHQVNPSGDAVNDNESNSEIIDSTIINTTINNEFFQKDMNMEMQNTSMEEMPFEFKSPAKVDNVHDTVKGLECKIDDIFYSDIEVNKCSKIIDNDTISLQSQKHVCRQRLRPSPALSNRRNSTMVLDNSEECLTGEWSTASPKRERHNSSSSTCSNTGSNQQSTQKTFSILKNTSMGEIHNGRMRTQSGCSILSDLNNTNSKSRKNDDHYSYDHQRQLLMRDFEARFSNGIPDKDQLKIFDFIYYNPSANPMPRILSTGKIISDEKESVDHSKLSMKQNQDKDDNSIDDVKSDLETLGVPQLMLNEKGELVIDDKSLVVESKVDMEARKILSNQSVIYLDENNSMKGFYRRSKRTREWQPAETIKFYGCLQTIGTDFSLMVQLFPNRTRRDLKLKFKKEERINPELVNKAILHPKEFNIEKLKKQVEEEEKAEKLKNEVRQQRKDNRRKTIEKTIKKKATPKQSAAGRVLDGDDIYQTDTDNDLQTATKKTRKTYGKIRNKITKNNAMILTSNNSKNTIEQMSNSYNEDSKQILENDMDTIDNRTIDAVKLKGRKYLKNCIKKDNNNINKGQHIELKTEGCNLSCGNNEQDKIQEEENKVTSGQLQPIDMSISIEAAMSEIQDNIEFELSSDVNSIQRTIIDLDNGIVTQVDSINSEHDDTSTAEMQVVNSVSPAESMFSNISGINEDDISTILQELEQGTLKLVSSVYSDEPEKEVAEVYTIDKDTGRMSENPLRMPNWLLEYVLSMMNV